jgi:hypothetical protein
MARPAEKTAWLDAVIETKDQELNLQRMTYGDW